MQDLCNSAGKASVDAFHFQYFFITMQFDVFEKYISRKASELYAEVKLHWDSKNSVLFKISKSMLS